MFSKEITIVNKYNGSYVCNTVKGFWSSGSSISINGTIINKDENLICRILKSEKGYVEPKNYVGSGWTLRNDDYIIKGKVTSVSSIANMKENYECMKITSVSTKDFGSTDMWHFEISGD